MSPLLLWHHSLSHNILYCTLVCFACRNFSPTTFPVTTNSKAPLLLSRWLRPNCGETAPVVNLKSLGKTFIPKTRCVVSTGHICKFALPRKGELWFRTAIVAISVASVISASDAFNTGVRVRRITAAAVVYNHSRRGRSCWNNIQLNIVRVSLSFKFNHVLSFGARIQGFGLR